MKRIKTMETEEQLRAPRMTEIAPGVYKLTDAKGKMPLKVTGTMSPLGGGEYRLRANPAKWRSLNAELLTALGLPKQTYHTLRRLGIAGFLRVMYVSPRVVLYDVDSIFEHLEKTRNDPDFWDPDGENAHQYNMARGSRGWHGVSSDCEEQDTGDRGRATAGDDDDY